MGVMEDADAYGPIGAMFWVLHWVFVATILGAGPAIVATTLLRRPRARDDVDFMQGYDAAARQARLLDGSKLS